MRLSQSLHKKELPFLWGQGSGGNVFCFCEPVSWLHPGFLGERSMEDDTTWQCLCQWSGGKKKKREREMVAGTGNLSVLQNSVQRSSWKTREDPGKPDFCPESLCLVSHGHVSGSLCFRRGFIDMTFRPVGINNLTSRSGSCWLTFLSGQQR